MKPAPTSFLPVLATMLLFVCIAPSARADRAENAFVIVEGDGVVRLDGKNFAVITANGENRTVKVLSQPNWSLDSSKYVSATLTNPGYYKAHNVINEDTAEGKIYLLKAEFITPAGDPVMYPVAEGVGKNEFTFSVFYPSALSINLKVKVSPDISPIRLPEGCFTVDSIGSSKQSWSAGNENGKSAFDGQYYTATASFSGLPDHNSDFGLKMAVFSIGGFALAQPYEVFFPKCGIYHPACNTCDNCPNWFYYWREGDVCSIPKDAKYSSQVNFGLTEIFETGPQISFGNQAAMINHGPHHEVSKATSSCPNLSITIAGTGEGIACVAEVSLHEQFHVTIYESYSSGSDRDDDGIADEHETSLLGIQSDPDDPNTYQLTIECQKAGDNEVRCYRQEIIGKPQFFPRRDWANPGCQSAIRMGPNP